MKRQTGSAMVMVLILTVAITSIVVATGGMTANAIRIVNLREAESEARYAVEGENLKNMSAIKAGTRTLESALAVVDTEPALEGVAVAVPFDYSATLAGSFKAVGSYRTNGKTYTYTEVLGVRRTPKPSQYALFVNSATSLSKTLTTGASGANGDAYFNGNLTLSATGNSIGGDLVATGTVTSSSLTVSETQYPSTTAIPWPTISMSTYLSAANTSYIGNQTWNGVTFSSAYRLLYINGNLTIKGSISGTGCIYVSGNVTINGNMSYATTGSRVAIISEGDITADSSTTSMVGYFYTASTFRDSGTSTLVVTGGVAAQALNLSAALSVTHDPAVWTDPTEGNRLKLPGFWP